MYSDAQLAHGLLGGRRRAQEALQRLAHGTLLEPDHQWPRAPAASRPEAPGMPDAAEQAGWDPQRRQLHCCCVDAIRHGLVRGAGCLGGGLAAYTAARAEADDNRITALHLTLQSLHGDDSGQLLLLLLPRGLLLLLLLLRGLLQPPLKLQNALRKPLALLGGCLHRLLGGHSGLLGGLSGLHCILRALSKLLVELPVVAKQRR